ncbi:hypothetical protein [Aquimarina sp. SS2-1]|uniref:hypothetical protein n=1 Tax=Aquimarina besae TaxID=3342247 RepID=UPI0036716B1C
MKHSLRKIKVNNNTYLWKREHHHLATFEHSTCVEKVTIYLEGCKKSPLRLFFREEDNASFKKDVEKEKWCVGYPDDGVVWLLKKDEAPETMPVMINLNRPGVIATLINYFLENGWQPETTQKPYEIKDALRYLEIIELPKGIT